MTCRKLVYGLVIWSLYFQTFAQPQQKGSIIFSEFMADPSRVSDANGEWLELYNTTDSIINIQGWVLKDSGSNWHEIQDSLVILPYSYLILARNADTTTNGGLAASYEYAGFILDNQEDELILMSGTSIVDQFNYTLNFKIESGKSAALSSKKLNANLNDSIQFWCNEAFSYGDGDNGSPGSINISCSINTGDVIISEIMIDPVQVNDVDGEWLELYNTTEFPLNLKGLILKDRDTDFHTISTDLGIYSKGYVVLTRNANFQENGGIYPNYSYDGLILSNEQDEVIIFKDQELIDSVAYKKSVFPMSQAKSINLDPINFNHILNNSGQSWCRASLVYGLGDKGTPGFTNESCGALPVKLNYFISRKTEGIIILEWATANEENHESFIILRSSDGNTFNQIAEITNTNKYPMGKRYTHYDLNPYSGLNYYRLIQLDHDGTSETLSTIRSDELNPLIKVYPNPISSQITITSDDLPTKIELLNNMGEILLWGKETRSLDTTSLAPGTFLIRVIFSRHVFVYKILKL